MIKFGTDGWRAVIAEGFTFDNVKLVAQAISDYLKSEARKSLKSCENKVVVGYDTRHMSTRCGRLIAQVLAGNGINVILTDKPTPTPTIVYSIKNMNLSGGVIVTASHNPATFNGIKFKASFAGSADPDITEEIENRIFKSSVQMENFDQAVKSGKITVSDLTPPYFEFLRGYIDMNLMSDKPMKVLVDAMHGATDSYMEKLLAGTKNDIKVLNAEPDPDFGGVNPEPIEKNMQKLAQRMKRGKYHLGFANDGDGDRIAGMTPDGKVITPHEILSLLLLHLVEDKGWKGSVVKTISSSSLIEKIAEKHHLVLHETPVGFKHICKLMREEDVLIGGEESGGIGFKNYIPDRDGMLCGLLLMEMIAHRNKAIDKLLEEMKKEYGRFCYKRTDIEYPEAKKKKLVPTLRKKPPARLCNKKVTDVKDYDGIKFTCEDGSWLLLRLSGTEPILRIYAEAGTKSGVEELSRKGQRIASDI